MWEIIEIGCWCEEDGFINSWQVEDEDGEPVQVFRNREDAEDWLAGQMEAAEMRARGDC